MRDIVTPETYRAVLERDGYRCVAGQIDARSGWCRDTWGNLITRWPSYPATTMLEIHHVTDVAGGAMGKRPPSDLAHLVALCPGHHRLQTSGVVWATRKENKERCRRYLSSFDPTSGRQRARLRP